MARAMGSTQEGYITNSPLHLIERNAPLFADSDDLLDLWPRILLLHGQKRHYGWHGSICQYV